MSEGRSLATSALTFGLVLLLPLFFLLAAGVGFADVRPHGLFSDGMVLQRGMQVPVWGNADDGEEVRVAFCGQTVTTVAESGKWMLTSLEKYFPQIWLKAHRAHCLIEQGEILAAREILEKESHVLEQGHEHQPLCTLFLGLSYLKEAQTLPIDQRDTFYTMARFYLHRSQINEGQSREKSRVITHLEDEAKILLTPDLAGEKSKWGFECGDRYSICYHI